MSQAKDIEVRYFSDPTFHRLVDTIVAIAIDKKWTVRDFSEAMVAADVRIREERNQLSTENTK